jgi:hypothetical protein
MTVFKYGTININKVHILNASVSESVGYASIWLKNGITLLLEGDSDT